MSQWVKPNHNFVPEYQVSSVPFVTSSNGLGELTLAGDPVKIQFPGVSRWVQVNNLSATTMRIGFSELGIQSKGAASGSNPVDGLDFEPSTTLSSKMMQANHRNFFTIAGSGSIGPWELKANEIWLDAEGNCDFSLIAGITFIPNANYFTLTGSVGIRGVG